MPGSIKPLRTIKAVSETVYKEKGSVFNGIIYPVSNEHEITVILQKLRKKYIDATHHCYAFKLKNDLFRYSDDGEPAGTAGIRILNAIDHTELCDVLCIVIRWFGGTKLGVGPLGKAYYLSAANAISNAETVIKMPFYEYIFTVPYEYTSQFYHVMEKFKAVILKRDYGQVPEFRCLLPVEDEKLLLSEIKHSSNNIITFLKEETVKYY